MNMVFSSALTEVNHSRSLWAPRRFYQQRQRQQKENRCRLPPHVYTFPWIFQVPLEKSQHLHSEVNFIFETEDSRWDTLMEETAARLKAGGNVKAVVFPHLRRLRPDILHWGNLNKWAAAAATIYRPTLSLIRVVEHIQGSLSYVEFTLMLNSFFATLDTDRLQNY